ncbi:MAG TPA: GDP-mannose 4,6-dehydratase [Dehalococcoidia bacterium]|nr:GDP-mannose 4,6-dehydratase [Dehalococcoidia bacterium]
MRILVTGGAGFIGSNLCDSLLGQGHEVIALDSLLTGRLKNLDSCAAHPNFEFIQRRTEDVIDVRPDAVFHLASPASPVGYGQHPIETLSANSEGTRRVLDLCRSTGAKFLLASTSEVYGDPLEHPQKETYFGNVDPIGPRSCYDEGKRFSEAMAVWYRLEYGVNTRIVRIFNCYGPRNALDDGRMVPTFIEQALRDLPMTVYGDGQQTRSLCYVTDMVAGLQAAMFSADTTGEVYNLGNPQEHTVVEFAQIIKELSSSRSEIVHVEGRDGEIARRKPDITKASRHLGWEPKVDLRDGLRTTVAWGREELGLVAPATA